MTNQNIAVRNDLTPEELRDSPWFGVLIENAKIAVEEYNVAKTEALFILKWHEVQARHTIGKLIVDNEHKVATLELLIKEVSGALGISERTVQYCIKAARTYPDMNQIPEGKSISWSRLVKTYLTDSKSIDPKGCAHPNWKIVKIKVCTVCGIKEVMN